MARGPRTIAQRIELEEAGKVEQQLNSIGQTGEKAFEQIAKAAVVTARQLETIVTIAARVETAFRGISAAGAAFGNAASGLGTAIGGVNSAIGNMVRNVALLAGGGGLLGLAAAQLIKFATGAATAADDLQESASAAGLSVDAYQRLKFALTDAGVAEEQFGRISSKLAQQFEEAKKAQTDYTQAVADLRRGVPGAEERVKSLGKAVQDTSNIFSRFGVDVRFRSLENAILAVGDRLKGLRTDSERAAAGQEALGRGGAKAAIGLAGLREALARTKEDFDRLKLSPEALKQADETSTALKRLSAVAELVRIRVGSIFDEATGELALAFGDALVKLTPELERLAKVVADAVVPVIRDLIRLMSGQEGEIQNQWIIEWRDNIVAFGAAINQVFTVVVPAAFAALKKALDTVAGAINAVFGTKVTGAQFGIILVIAKITGALGVMLAALRLLPAAINLVWSAFGLGARVVAGLATLIGWPALLAVAFATAAVAIIANWDAIKKAAFDTWDAIKAKWSKPPTDAERLPAGQSGLDLLLTNLIKASSNAWNAIKKQWQNNPVILPEGKSALELVFDELLRLSSEAWEKIKRQWSQPVVGEGLPEGKTALELLFDRLVTAAQTAWNRIKEIWAKSPVEDRGLPAGQSALSLLLSGTRADDAAAAKALEQQADALSELHSRQTQVNQTLTQSAAAQATTTAATEAATTATTAATEGNRVFQQSMVDAGTAMVTIGASGFKAIQSSAAAAKPAVDDLYRTIANPPMAGGGWEQAPGFPQRYTGPEPGHWLRRRGGGGGGAMYFAPIVGQAVDAKNQIIGTFQQVPPGISQALTVPAGGAAAPTAAGAPAAPGGAAGPFAILVTQAQAAKNAIVAIFQGLAAAIEEAIRGGAAAGPGGAVAGPVAAGGGEAAAASVGPFSGLVEAARAAVAAIQQAFIQLGGTLGQGLDPALQAVASKLQEMISVVGQVGQSFQAMASSAVAALDQVIQKLNEAIQKARELAQAGGGTLPGGVGAQPYATGGYTGGGPTNRVAGVVHAGEYVVPARVVRQSGMLGFLEQLRRVGDLDAVLARFVNGFANGGLVPSVNLAPRFAYADGGAVGRPRNLGELTLKNEAGMRIGRVWADRETAESLVRYATREAARSGGRKPQRHGAN